MDLWLLWLEGKLLRKKSSMRRLLAGSAAGAFGAAAGILLPGMPKIILGALLPALMQQITYGRRISLFSGCLFLLFAACLAGGFVELAGRISGFHSFFLWFPAVLFLGGLVVLFEELKREERRLCQVRLVWQNQSICLTGFWIPATVCIHRRIIARYISWRRGACSAGRTGRRRKSCGFPTGASAGMRGLFPQLSWMSYGSMKKYVENCR